MQSYERVKFGIGVPTAGRIHASATYGLMNIVGMLSQAPVYPESREQSMAFLIQVGSTIGANRQKIVDAALEKDCTHLLFVDDDMEITAEAFLTMARRRMPIVVCNYRMRGPKWEFTAMRPDHTNRVDTNKASSGLEPCEYAGFGLSLIETDVFRAMKPPFFMNRYINGAYSTEDVPFFLDAKAAGFQPYVDHDASKMIAHVGEQTYRWNLDYSEREVE